MSPNETTLARRPPKPPRPTPVPRVRSALVDALAPEDVPDFWDRIATRLPLVEETGRPGECVVTFCWRDHDAEEVLLFANRLTDEQDLAGTLLEHKAGTDLWHASFLMESDWRASYAFLPRRSGRPAPWEVDGQVALRAALDRGHPDRRNPDTITNARGHVQSVVSLPDAPAQPWLDPRPEVPRGTVEQVAGPDGREVRLYDPAGVPRDARLPLVVVLDAEIWTESVDVTVTLDNLVHDGVLTPVRAVLVAAGTREERWEELAGTAVVDRIADELVPWVRRRRALTERVVVVGQSLGGLTALRAGLARPDVVTDVVSQSASLWVDDLSGLVAPGNPVRVHLAHGRQEWVLAGPHQELAAALRRAGLDVAAVDYNGGHDLAWWRGAVADGLRHVLRDQPVQ